MFYRIKYLNLGALQRALIDCIGLKANICLNFFVNNVLLNIKDPAFEILTNQESYCITTNDMCNMEPWDMGGILILRRMTKNEKVSFYSLRYYL